MRNEEIKKVSQKGIEFTFVFADMHALHNGYDKNTVNSYIENIKGIFNKFKYFRASTYSVFWLVGCVFKKS